MPLPTPEGPVITNSLPEEDLSVEGFPDFLLSIRKLYTKFQHKKRWQSMFLPSFKKFYVLP